MSSFDVVKDSSAQLSQSLCTRHFTKVGVCHTFEINTTLAKSFANATEAPIVEHILVLIVLRSYYETLTAQSSTPL